MINNNYEISVIESAEYLDLAGWHDRNSYGLGTT